MELFLAEELVISISVVRAPIFRGSRSEIGLRLEKEGRIEFFMIVDRSRVPARMRPGNAARDPGIGSGSIGCVMRIYGRFNQSRAISVFAERKRHAWCGLLNREEITGIRCEGVTPRRSGTDQRRRCALGTAWPSTRPSAGTCLRRHDTDALGPRHEPFLLHHSEYGKHIVVGDVQVFRRSFSSSGI